MIKTFKYPIAYASTLTVKQLSKKSNRKLQHSISLHCKLPWAGTLLNIFKSTYKPEVFLTFWAKGPISTLKISCRHSCYPLHNSKGMKEDATSVLQISLGTTRLKERTGLGHRPSNWLAYWSPWASPIITQCLSNDISFCWSTMRATLLLFFKKVNCTTYILVPKRWEKGKFTFVLQQQLPQR